MNSDTESSYRWNTVNRKKNKKKEDDMVFFFKKIKKELDKEFHFLNEKDKKDKNEKNEKNKGNNIITPKNIFSLLLSDSE